MLPGRQLMRAVDEVAEGGVDTMDNGPTAERRSPKAGWVVVWNSGTPVLPVLEEARREPHSFGQSSFFLMWNKEGRTEQTKASLPWCPRELRRITHTCIHVVGIRMRVKEEGTRKMALRRCCRQRGRPACASLTYLFWAQFWV